MILISEVLRKSLCEQIAEEMYNANLYLYICGFFKNKGFDNIAKMFEKQWSEETEHAKIIFDLLTSLNADIIIPQISAVELSFAYITDIAAAYLEREIETTTSLQALRDMAYDDSNPVVEEKMREMIKKQEQEYEEATSFMDKAEILGSDWKAVLLWDASLNGG